MAAQRPGLGLAQVMRELLNFFIRNSKWFVFAAYFAASLFLLIRSNPFADNIYLTSANAVASSVYNFSDGVTGYLNLKSENADLNRRNADLLREIEVLKAQNVALGELLMTDSIAMPDILSPYDFVVATVIKNSVMHPNNYITINKGSDDGVMPEMGVIDANGVVGVVGQAGHKYSRLISLLNPNFRLSCKIKDNDSFGSLVWNGKDPRYATLEELPRHTEYNVGDTVVTSGYSSVFPAGIPVGIVEGSAGTTDADNMFALHIRLLTDFSKLKNVQIIVNYVAEDDF